ncbi:MAG TPA: type IV pilus secretin PilQ [Solimonas sp.]
MKTSSFPLTRGLKLGFALMVLALAAGAQSPERTLQGIDFVALDGNRVLVTLSLSGTAPEPAVFTIDKPARLSLDLPDTAVALNERFRKVNVGNVRSIAAVEARGRTRVVVELGEAAPYNLRVDGNKVLLQLDGGTPAAIAAPQGPYATPVAAEAGAGIRNVDFRRGEKGEGRIVVRLQDPRTVVDVREERGQIVATFRNTALPANLERRLDVLDFATPVKFVDIRREGINSQVLITPSAGAEFDQAAYQSGDQFTIELQPVSAEKKEELAREAPEYTGERISLSFQNVDIRSLLQIIADVAGTNMVISDDVQGQIAMRLQNVPWDQALDIILKTKGLGVRQQGNVMLVAPVEELAKRERAELEAEKQKKELSPLRSEIIQVNYARASNIRALLASENTSMLSERGRISVDDRTNTLLVLETREKIAEMRNLVARLDIPVRQVLIESRIVIANEDFAREIGTRFGVNTIAQRGNTRIGQSGGNLGSRDVIAGNIPSLDDSYVVNLPTQSTPAGRIGWTILGADFLLDLELSALQSEGRGEVISTPRVVTANGKQAMIEQGREIPYQSAAGGGAVAQTEFKKAVLSLTVTPQITPDDRVVMDLGVTNDSQGEDVSTGLGSAPAIDTRRLDTQVLIRSGETVVLGGVFQQENRRSAGKVPLLGDIPLLGALFRNSTRSDNKRELLIFVTPRVLQEGLNVN